MGGAVAAGRRAGRRLARPGARRPCRVPGGSYVEVYETLADDACTIGDADVGLILCITGNPPYETDVEFGVVIYDQKGNPSNGGAAFIATFRTPDSNGNY